MVLEFWGVRGSLPAPGAATIRYGGDTLCVSVMCGPHLLILDAGTGARALGIALAAAANPIDADILLSHTHLDHICGLPFFAPLYDPESKLRFWGGSLSGSSGIESALMASWCAPLMPDVHQSFRACRTFHDFGPDEKLLLQGRVAVSTVRLCHPGNAYGYRIDWGGSSICYITDTEHPASGLDTNLVKFIADTDILIYDGGYTDDEYATRVGWGHSTWRAAADLADAARVGRVVLYHHEPSHDDDMMDAIAQDMALRRPGSLVAKQGMRLVVKPARRKS